MFKVSVLPRGLSCCWTEAKVMLLRRNNKGNINKSVFVYEMFLWVARGRHFLKYCGYQNRTTKKGVEELRRSCGVKWGLIKNECTHIVWRKSAVSSTEMKNCRRRPHNHAQQEFYLLVTSAYAFVCPYLFTDDSLQPARCTCCPKRYFIFFMKPRARRPNQYIRNM